MVAEVKRGQPGCALFHQMRATEIKAALFVAPICGVAEEIDALSPPAREVI